MKKNNILICLTGLMLGTLLSVNPLAKVDPKGLVEQSIDNNNNSVQLNLRNTNIGESASVLYSNTFVQVGVSQDTGNNVLRFATAVSGPIKSAKYVRTAEGLEDKEKEVTTVYKGIETGDKVAYYDGSDIVYEETEATKNYYWACYSIEYETETYKNLDVTVSLEVTGEDEQVYTPLSKTTSLANETVAPVTLSSLEIVDGLSINHGDSFENHKIVVKGFYSNGSSRELDPYEYTVNLPSYSYAVFGKEAKYTVVSKENSDISTSAVLSVVNHIEAENGIVVGGKTKAEPEYVLEGDTFVEKEDVTFAGGFIGSVKSGQEGSVTLNYNSYADVSGEFTVRISNSFLQKNADGYYYMENLQFNSVLDVLVNDEPIAVSDEVVISGTPVYTTEKGAFAPLYGVYHNITFENINFKAGTNSVKFKFKLSTLDDVNSWGDSPSEANIDYVEFVTKGTTVSEDATITSIEVDNLFAKPVNGDKVSELKVPVIATFDDGTRALLDEDLYTVTVNGEDEEYFVTGEYEIVVTLKENSNIKTTKTFTVEKEEIYIQSEGASISGDTSKVKSTNGTEWVNGNKTTTSVTVMGGMDASTTKYSGTTSITHTYTSNSAGTAKLYIRCTNANESAKTAPYSAPSYELNQVVKLQVNGKDVTFKAVIPAFSHQTQADCDWWSFTELEIGDVQLQQGENRITIIGDSGSSLRNCWDEIPVPKFDYVKLVK